MNENPVGDAPTGAARVDVAERRAWSTGGWPALGLTVLLFAAGAALAALASSRTGAAATTAGLGAGALLVVAAVLLTGLTVVAPGETRVVVFFGSYLGTIRRTGLTFTWPLTGRSKVPVRILNFETETLKVNERNGSPVQISAIVVWQVDDTAKAHFAVDDYRAFIHSQAESALRQVVARHPYDHQAEQIAAVVSDDVLDHSSTAGSTAGSADDDITLREDGGVVGDELAREVNARVQVAGLDVVEVRLSNLSYAPEIAGAMLQRQQAQAVLDARRVVVDGAVGIVAEALVRLESESGIELDPERRAAMTSNLLTVVVGGHAVQPIVNVGSLYS